MTKEELIARYAALDSTSKVRFLARCAFYLTVGLRGYYDSPDPEERAKKLTGANELQHHLSSELLHHHDDLAERYPNDVLMNILVEKTAAYGISGEMGTALARSLDELKQYHP